VRIKKKKEDWGPYACPKLWPNWMKRAWKKKKGETPGLLSIHTNNAAQFRGGKVRGRRRKKEKKNQNT